MTTERSSEPTHVDPFAPREPRPDSPPPRDEPRNQETSVNLFPPRDRADRARDEAADTSDRQPDHTDPFAKKNRTAEETPPPPPSEASEPRDPDAERHALSASHADEGPAEPRAERGPSGTAAIANTAQAEPGDGQILDARQTDEFRGRWEQCQQHFVDEPKASVESADELVAEVMQKVAQQFVITRESLEQQWDRGDQVSTDDLRLAMQKYRDFFNRLLAA
jgi:hypothetical protein